MYKFNRILWVLENLEVRWLEVRRGYTYIVSSSGETLRITNRKIRVIFSSVILFLVCLVAISFLLLDSLSSKIELQKTLTIQEEEIAVLKETNSEYKSYIEKIELELESIKTNFETYKMEVKKGVKEEE